MPRFQKAIAPGATAATTLLTLALTLFNATQVNASHDPMQVCDIAAERAARASDVPLDVLKAITRTETGRALRGRFGPWAWTVNMEGKGIWFESEDAARRYVYKQFKRGARSFDVGCFQINYKWHHKEFTSIDEMFEPMANARYAARFLSELKAELGSWQKAVGAYHSRTPKHTRRYTRIYNQHLASLRASPSGESVPAERDKTGPKQPNRYPLLQRAGGSAAAGSLVMLSSAGPRQMFPRARPIWGTKP